MLQDDARKSLEGLFSKGMVTTDPVEVVTYETDGGLTRGAPMGVVFPQSTDDVARLVHWAKERDIPLVSRSSGTGLSGGAVPCAGGIVVSFSRMDRVLEVNGVDRLAVVEPGVVNLTLDELVKGMGYYYPPDPASQRACAIGGNIAENAGGPRCFKYGVTSNYVMGLEVVLADGRVAHTGGRGVDYPEYDFTGLLTGSEGTLAVITGALLRLIRKPVGFKTLIATFDSVEEAGQAVSAIIAEGLVPAALEMMDRTIVGIIEDYVHAGLPTDATALLLIEVDGYPASLDPQVTDIVAVLERQGVRRIDICRTEAEREQIWRARKSAFGAMARISPAYFQVDGTVPRSRLAETLEGINQICKRLDLHVGFVFHAGDGNLHPMIPFDPADRDMDARVHQAGDEILALCVSKDGSISGEHGVGLEKRKYMPLMYSSDELGAMRQVKELFDPRGILNPGKILPPCSESASQSPMPALARLPALFTPTSEPEAAEGLRAAQERDQAVRISGGRTQHIDACPGDAVELSTKGLQGIVALSPDDLYVTVRCGTRLAEVQEALAPHRLWVPLCSPWADTTVGGIISTGFNNPCRMRYGSVRDQVLGLRVVLPDGRQVRFGRPVVKNVAGYDMVKLFVGAHGTLGLITEVTLRLTALPRATRSFLIPVDELDTASSIAQSLMQTSLIASAVLLFRGCPIPGLSSSPYAIVLTVEGYPQDVVSEFEAARAVVNGIELDEPSGLELWCASLRSAPSYLRVGVPPKALLEYLKSNATALGGTYTADIASGLVYASPVPVDQVARLRMTASAAGGYAVVAGGVDGLSLDRWGYVPETLSLMQGLKARWDPKGCLNAGVFVV